MSSRDEKIQTPYGEAKYTVYTCDNCGKHSLASFHLNIIGFYREYEYLWRAKHFEDFYKSACSLECFRLLLNESFVLFETLYKEYHNL